jgi:hypothetical protein
MIMPPYIHSKYYIYIYTHTRKYVYMYTCTRASYSFVALFVLQLCCCVCPVAVILLQSSCCSRRVCYTPVFRISCRSHPVAVFLPVAANFLLRCPVLAVTVATATCKFDRPLRNDFGPLFLIPCIKKGSWMGIPRIQAFFNGRSNLHSFCKSQYIAVQSLVLSAVLFILIFFIYCFCSR